MERRCETCVHWWFAEKAPRGRVGRCSLADSFTDKTKMWINYRTASNGIYTTSDFGCVQHELRRTP